MPSRLIVSTGILDFWRAAFLVQDEGQGEKEAGKEICKVHQFIGNRMALLGVTVQKTHKAFALYPENVGFASGSTALSKNKPAAAACGLLLKLLGEVNKPVQLLAGDGEPGAQGGIGVVNQLAHTQQRFLIRAAGNQGVEQPGTTCQFIGKQLKITAQVVCVIG